MFKNNCNFTAIDLVETFQLNENDLVDDIASNDGYDVSKVIIDIKKTIKTNGNR